jgi:hypothetical protein
MSGNQEQQQPTVMVDVMLEFLFMRHSPERERERFHARIEKLDLELSSANRSRLPNQLIQALLGHRAVPLSSTSLPWPAPGGCPSMNTRKRTAPRARLVP